MGFAEKPAEYKKEEVNAEYVSLYIEEPKVYQADDGVIIQLINDFKKGTKFVD